MSRRKSITCRFCLGTVYAPKGQRKITLEQSFDNHRESCPGLPPKMKKENPS